MSSQNLSDDAKWVATEVATAKEALANEIRQIRQEIKSLGELVLIAAVIASPRIDDMLHREERGSIELRASIAVRNFLERQAR